MHTASGALAHDDLKIWQSTFIIFIVGVVEIAAMNDSGDGFADFIDVRLEVNMGEFDLHMGEGQAGKVIGETRPNRWDIYIQLRTATPRVQGIIVEAFCQALQGWGPFNNQFGQFRSLSRPSEWFRQVTVMLAQDELFVPRKRSFLFSFELSSPGLVKILEPFEDAAGSQDNIHVEIAQVITSLSYHCCGRVFHLPVHLILPSRIRLSRSAPQLTASQGAHQAFLMLCHVLISLNLLQVSVARSHLFLSCHCRSLR
jgi:hypothetical protein